jgi:hypothetical protein
MNHGRRTQLEFCATLLGRKVHGVKTMGAEHKFKEKIFFETEMSAKA